MMKFPVEGCADCYVHLWAGQIGMQHTAGAMAHTMQHVLAQPVTLPDSNAR